MFKKNHSINTGRVLSKETKEKISKSNKGKVISIEQINKTKKTKLEKRKKRVNEYLKNPKYCGCGCGQIVMPDNDRRGFYLRKFIDGHFDRSKFNPMSGKKQTNETKEKISNANSGNRAWNKGLNKFDDDIIMRASIRMSLDNPSCNKEINKKMINTKIKNGTNITGPIKAMETKYKNGTVGGGRCKWYQYNGKKVQGKFELKFAKFLDSIELKWESHKGLEVFNYIGLDGKEHRYQPDFCDENGVYYDPHAKYYWDDIFEHKISEVRRLNPDKTFIVFHEDNYLDTCKKIIENLGIKITLYNYIWIIY